jgi:hypothetical protein
MSNSPELPMIDFKRYWGLFIHLQSPKKCDFSRSLQIANPNLMYGSYHLTAESRKIIFLVIDTSLMVLIYAT